MESSFYGLKAWFWSTNTSKPGPNNPSIYRSLDKAKREIRICDLVASSKVAAPLRCSLRTVPIDQAGSFIAMSYVWGKATSSEFMSIDGSKHPIRPNLAAGLRQLRARLSGQHQVISIWADAICINQNSIEERNHQVPLMRAIFSGCESAFAWLGDSDETSDLAMDCIAKLDQFGQKGMIGSASFLWMLVQEKFFWEAEPWIAITGLLSREFWYRVWIYQEIVLPRNLLIACGTKVLPWKIFRALNGMKIFRGGSDNSRKLIRRHFSHLDSAVRDEINTFCNNLHPIFDHKSHFDDGQRLTLFELLAETIHLQSTDPRDKIYGLLALDQGSKICPDYSKTVEEVYTGFAVTMLLDNLAYLRFSGLSVRESNKPLTAFPSWVPHWESMSRTITSTALQQGKVFEFPHISRTHFDFGFEQDSTVLYIDGEISSMISWAQEYSDVPKIKNFQSLINRVSGTEYKTTVEYPKTPTQRMIALCCTLVHHLLLRDSLEDMDIAAGFCFTVCERLEVSTHETTSLVKAELLSCFGDYFGWIPWTRAFNRAEKTQKDYLLREKENLKGKILFETDDGYFGLGPVGVEEGDFLCQIYGYHDPVVLRRVGGHYVLVGSCWALDYTDHYGETVPVSATLEIW